jgi:hypothetical protein
MKESEEVLVEEKTIDKERKRLKTVPAEIK